MTDTSSIHIPVLMQEVLEALAPKPGGVIVDGTLGGGGHTRALAELVGPTGRILSLDRDLAAVDRMAATVGETPIQPIHANYRDLPEVLNEVEIDAVDGVLLDLGLSSDQLADRERGFSFEADGPLDLRFDLSRGEPAYRLLDRLDAERLADIIYQYGEERMSRRIARKIVERRRESPIRTARELASLVRSCMPRGKGRQRIDPATRTFQALRIAVNEELDALDDALRRFPDRLRPGGRLAIISFHSLEDRRVKTAFRGDDRLKNLTKKPIVPSEAETAENPRARSAKLRVAERVEEVNARRRFSLRRQCTLSPAISAGKHDGPTRR